MKNQIHEHDFSKFDNSKLIHFIAKVGGQYETHLLKAEYSAAENSKETLMIAELEAMERMYKRVPYFDPNTIDEDGDTGYGFVQTKGEMIK